MQNIIYSIIFFSDNVGKEIVSRFTTNFQTNKTFYTDANGRQMIKRTIDERSTWNVTIDEPIAGYISIYLSIL